MWRCVCVHLYVTVKGRTRYSMVRQKNYRERVKGDRTFNNSWYASDVISYSSDVVSISPDESLIYNYLRFSPASTWVWGQSPKCGMRKNKRPFIEGVEEESHRLEIAVSVSWMRKGCTSRYNSSQIQEIRLEELVGFLSSLYGTNFFMHGAFYMLCKVFEIVY